MTTLTAATPTMMGGLVPSPMARMAAAPPPGVTAADLWRIIRQRLVLIISLWVFFIGLTAGVTAFKAKYYPEYMATAVVEVKSTDPLDVLNPLEQKKSGTLQKDVELLVQNQAVLLKNPAVLGDVYADARIKETEFYHWVDTDKKDEDRIELLSDVINVVPEKNTNFLKVYAIWRSRKDVPLLVNTVVDKYVEKANAMQRGAIERSRVQLEEEVTRAQNACNDVTQRLDAMRSGSSTRGIPRPEPSEQLLTLQALVTELDVDMIGRKAQYESLMNVSPDQLPITAELQAILEADPTIMQLERLAQDADTNLRQLLSTYGQNHVMVKRATVARDTLAETAAAERAAKLLHYQKEQIDQAQRNYYEAIQQKAELQNRLTEALAEQSDRDKEYTTYLRLTEEQELRRRQRDDLLDQQNLMNMVTRARALVQIGKVSDATEPKVRFSPKWIIWLPAGTILGLMISLGFAALLEVVDKSVRTPRDVARVPVLGLIPSSDDDEVEIERVETASIDVPHSILAEAFRSLRANLFFSAPAEQQGVILVTSPSGGNGKTTIASNLAISIALSGRRVLLIDANFRRPALPRLFPGMRQEGLSNILIGQGRLSDMATSTSVPGLDVLCSGPTPPNPAELLGSSYLRDVVADARSQYDQVIFDGPPVLLVSDAMVLAGAVDGVLVVCQYRSTSRGAFHRTQAQLEAINARVFGAVLNRVETRAGGYFRKAYREFYEYQEPEDGAQLPRLRLDVKTADAASETPRGTGEVAPAELEAAAKTVTSANGDAKPKRKPRPGATSVKASEAGGVAAPGMAVNAGGGGAPATDDFGLDLDLKIDDNFDLGEDLDKPDEPPPGDGKPGT